MSYTSKNQRGMATLVTAVVLMLAVFGVTYFVSETVINESQIVTNDFRAKEAFFVAQGGIEYARTVADSAACSPSCTVAVGGIDAAISISSAANSSIYEIESIGKSRDNTVSRRITYAVGRMPGEIEPPKVPIVARGGLGLTGNVKAVNNVDALTVWSGAALAVNGSANTYIKIDSNKNQLSTIKSPGGNNITGPDVISNDPNLQKNPGVILEAFFGISIDDEADYSSIKASDLEVLKGAGSVYEMTSSTDGLSDYDIQNDWDEEKIYFHDGPISLSSSYLTNRDIPTASLEKFGNTEWQNIVDSSEVAGNGFKTKGSYIGSPSSPVLIVSSGTVTIGSGVTVFGVIIADKVELSGGNPEIVGGMVVLDGTSNAVTGAGNPTVIMDELVMKDTLDSDSYGPIKSSWKDW